MLDDIKKILKVSQRGIVVMENGKPSYVIVPFEDYIESTSDNNKHFSSNAINTEKNSLFDDDLLLNEKFDFDFSENKNKDSIYDDLKEIKLEDLPF